MSEPLIISAIVHAVKFDRDGECLITLEVSQEDGPKVAALALQTQQVFEVTFEPGDNPTTQAREE